MWKQQPWSHVSGQGFGNRSIHMLHVFLQKRVDKQERPCDVYESKKQVLVHIASGNKCNMCLHVEIQHVGPTPEPVSK